LGSFGEKKISLRVYAARGRCVSIRFSPARVDSEHEGVMGILMPFFPWILYRFNERLWEVVGSPLSIHMVVGAFPLFLARFYCFSFVRAAIFVLAVWGGVCGGGILLLWSVPRRCLFRCLPLLTCSLDLGGRCRVFSGGLVFRTVQTRSLHLMKKSLG